jgi:hypothetical protein
MAEASGIAAGDGSRPEGARGRRWLTRDGSRPEVARGLIWMDDRRWMTGYGSQEMDHGRRMTINLLPFYAEIEVLRS